MWGGSLARNLLPAYNNHFDSVAGLVLKSPSSKDWMGFIIAFSINSNAQRIIPKAL
jgi:hypothetical protein